VGAGGFAAVKFTAPLPGPLDPASHSWIVAPEIGNWPPLTCPENAEPATGGLKLGEAPQPRNTEETMMDVAQTRERRRKNEVMVEIKILAERVVNAIHVYLSAGVRRVNN
jgi:hypothetical protein